MARKEEGEKGRWGEGEKGRNSMSRKIVRHQDLEVYRKAFEAAMRIFELSKQFPKEETYSLTDQVRRASRSVCSNIAEAWRKRRYEAAFISKLNDAEGEAAETQTWLEFAVRCEYLKPEVGRVLFKTYNEIISMLISMINNPKTWVLPSGQRRTGR
jgi:four helix bundle protein